MSTGWVRRTGLGLAVGVGLFVGVGCSTGGDAPTTTGGDSTAVACALFHDARATVDGPTAEWVAAGRPSDSRWQQRITDALVAQPALFASAVAVAPASLVDELELVESTTRDVAAVVSAGRSVTKADQDVWTAALFAAESACSAADASA
jgi:hypothetical protein